MRFSLMAALLLASTVALAHGPTRQKVTESVTVKATPDQVWAALKDFGAMEKWHPAVEKTVADKGSSVGSTRTLTLKGGGTVVEELESYSDADRKLSYRMKDPGPIPVSNYSATISVKPADGGSVVEWRGAFYRKFMNNDPPPDQNDEAAVKAITGVYQAGLANIKAMFEKK
ncbi:SRPBCC family protein [Accumulibacter sp.]|uniref:SRPBCC family protein n=2 Tax=Accumulibacter sp. TaxID=2053492 RepID=UPI002CF16826|nr:SRPBCC family protein [Accumulibacter sp.]HNH93598.1 SRPBCC family protein [Accumulibacter sp.]